MRPKAYALLQHLVAHPNVILGRSELTRALWPEATVTDESLTQLVRDVRRAINDPDGKVLCTVAGRGYLFAGPHTGLPGDTPRLGGLSPPATSFFGRTSEIKALREQLAAHRLVTITGMGGVGKTRLMLRLAEEMAVQPSAVLYGVDLSPVEDEAGVAEAIANALGAGRQAGSALQAIIASLRKRPTLMLIDNAEHVAAALAALLQSVLAQCPKVSILVTSRVSLAIPAESLLPLPPLPLPPPGACDSVEHALRFDVIRLFVDRATMLNPGFRLAQADPEIVAEICRRLDGLTLSIELAVPRLQVLTAAELLQRLDQRFDLLATRAPGLPARQRSLWAMLEWSRDLLDPAAQELLLKLGIFTGSASLAALVGMSAGASGEAQLLDQLGLLVRASLVVAEPQGARPRFRLLETTRAFALHVMPPARADAWRRQHLALMAATMEEADALWPTMPGPAWLACYGPDADNVRAALTFAFGAGNDVAAGLRLLAASLPLWWELPALPLRESRHWFALGVARISPATPLTVQARLWLGHSWQDIQIGDIANFPAAEQAVALYRTLDDPLGLGAALWRAGCSLLLFDNLAQAADLLAEAERLLRAFPPTKWLALTLIRQAGVMSQLGEQARNQALCDEALTIARATQYGLGLMLAANSLADMQFESGQTEAAIATLQGALHGLARGLRIPPVSTLATQLAAIGREAEALEAIAEVLDQAGEAGLLTAMVRVIEALAMLLAVDGRIAPAARLFGYVLTSHAASRKRTGGRRVVYERLTTGLAAAGPTVPIGRLMEEGANWSDSHARQEDVEQLARLRPERTSRRIFPEKECVLASPVQ